MLRKQWVDRTIAAKGALDRQLHLPQLEGYEFEADEFEDHGARCCSRRLTDCRLSSCETATSATHDSTRFSAQVGAYVPLHLWQTADGGADRNHSFLKPQLALLALARCLRVPRLTAMRGIPYQSYLLTGERPMSLLQLGINSVALTRGNMSDASEALVRSCGSMNDIRVAGDVKVSSKASTKTKVACWHPSASGHVARRRTMS